MVYGNVVRFCLDGEEYMQKYGTAPKPWFKTDFLGGPSQSPIVMPANPPYGGRRLKFRRCDGNVYSVNFYDSLANADAYGKGECNNNPNKMNYQVMFMSVPQECLDSAVPLEKFDETLGKGQLICEGTRDMKHAVKFKAARTLEFVLSAIGLLD